MHFKWVVSESSSDIATQFLDEFIAGQHDFIAPDFFPIELLHALTRAERQGRVSVGQGGQQWSNIMNLGIEFIPSIPLAPRAYEISSAARIGVYDCVYLALAERDVIDFITADDKLIKSMKSQFPCLVSLESRT